MKGGRIINAEKIARENFCATLNATKVPNTIACKSHSVYTFRICAAFVVMTQITTNRRHAAQKTQAGETCPMTTGTVNAPSS